MTEQPQESPTQCVQSFIKRVGTTGTVWLVLTIGCAQCHDHKFDPITQKDFYQMFAFLNNQDEPRLKVYPDDIDASKLDVEKKQIEKHLQSIVHQHANSVAEWEQALDEDDKLRKDLAEDVKKVIGVEAKKRKRTDNLTILAARGALDSLNEVKTNQVRIAAIDREWRKVFRRWCCPSVPSHDNQRCL